MKINFSDVLVLGAGVAGLAAASKAKELGTKNVVLLDEKDDIGGVLPQCIHPGFGLHYYKEDLTGPEFAIKLYERVKGYGVEIFNSIYALELLVKGKERIIRAVGLKGLIEFRSKTVIFATGARERHYFEIGIVGYRPIGVYTAGQAQTMMDLYGVMLGKEVVIIGSGDIGLILARRLALQGASIKAVIEILPYPGGSARNIQQCLIDFEIPLCISHKAMKIHGKKRVYGVTVAKVDENLREIPGTEFEIKCDMIIVSTGLIPRVELLERSGVNLDPATRSVVVNELLETSTSGVYVAGNALIINDLADSAAVQGELAAKSAVDFVQNWRDSSVCWKSVIKGRNIRCVVPQLVSCQRDVSFYGRVVQPEENVYLKIPEIQAQFHHLKVKPPEMFTFNINKNKLEKLKDNKITVAIEHIK